MNKQTWEEMKSSLLKEQASLRAQLEKTGKHEKGTTDDFSARFPDYGTDEDENALEVSTYQNRLSIDNDFEKSLLDVDHALEKIEDGTYGKCENCGKEIGLDRLRAMPAARLCTDCMELKK